MGVRLLIILGLVHRSGQSKADPDLRRIQQLGNHLNSICQYEKELKGDPSIICYNPFLLLMHNISYYEGVIIISRRQSRPS